VTGLFGVAVTASALGLALVAPPALAQTPAPDTATEPQVPAKTVEGATPDRVALVNACGGHKFEANVEIDPVAHRSTRVKLCSKPGATDADWVKTLEAAIAQIKQRPMPASAKQQLIGELKAEVAVYQKGASGSPVTLGQKAMIDTEIQPQAAFVTSVLPPLVPKTKAKGTSGGASLAPVVPIRATLKCLMRGESGKGSTCDFFEKDTVVLVTAIAGLEKGATFRFRRRGDDVGEVAIAATSSGQTRRVVVPAGICRGISHSKVEIEVQGSGETQPGAHFGPYGLRC
jgi:hypothetical protein